MNKQTEVIPRVAPPEKAAAILRSMGYPVDAKLLRRLYKAGYLPGTWTGKRLLLSIAKAAELFENGMPAEPPGPIRRVEG